MKKISLMFMLFTLNTIYASQYISSVISGDRNENVISNGEFLVTNFYPGEISIFKSNDLLIKFDITMIEDYLGHQIDEANYDFEYDYIKNKIFFQDGRNLVSYDLENNGLSKTRIDDVWFNGFFPNGKKIYLKTDSSIVEYNIESDEIITTYKVINNSRNFYSINENEISYQDNNRIFIIRNGEQIMLFENKNAKISAYKILKFENNYFLVYNDSDDYTVLNIFDVEKQKVVKKVGLNQIGNISFSQSENQIFYSNKNYVLESLNLLTLNTQELGLSCQSAFGNNGLFFFNNRGIIHYKNNFSSQVTIGYGISRLRDIEYINENYLLLFEDVYTHSNLYILDLKGNVTEKFSITGYNYQIIGDLVYYQDINKDLFVYNHSKHSHDKLNNFDSDRIKMASSFLVKDNNIYFSAGKIIYNFNINQSKLDSLVTQRFIRRIVDVDNDNYYIFNISNDIDYVNLSRINKNTLELESMNDTYSTFLVESKRYLLKDDLLYIINNNRKLELINYKELQKIDSIITNINNVDLKLIENEIYLCSDSIVYILIGTTFRNLFQYEKNYNIRNAQFISGLVSFTIRNNQIIVIDKEGVIWKDNLLTSKVKVFSDYDNYLEEIENEGVVNIELFDVNGRKLREYNSVNELLNGVNANPQNLRIVIITTLRNAHTIKIFN